MFPKIFTVQTRVTTLRGQHVVEFYNTFSEEWEADIELTFTSSGMVIFTLDTDCTLEPYVFFGALQQVPKDSTPDTNWDFVINGEGNIISFTNSCKNAQEIAVRLTLVPSNAEDIDDAIISADPRIKNKPD